VTRPPPLHASALLLLGNRQRPPGRHLGGGRVSAARPGGPDDLLGLASPTHRFNLPPITLAFLFAVPRAPRRNRALIFNTRAGLRLLGLHLPGLSGVAQLHAALVLSIKGYRVVAMRPGRPFWSATCESCMRCMNHCPRRAIETAHGFVIGVALLVEVALATLVLPPLLATLPWLGGQSLLARLARDSLETAILFRALVVSYRLLHRALRHRAVDRLVTLTSLTHFRWWRRYRVPRALR
jgi:ferredoxin